MHVLFFMTHQHCHGSAQNTQKRLVERKQKSRKAKREGRKERGRKMKRKEKKMKGKLEMMQRETLRETNPKLQ